MPGSINISDDGGHHFSQAKLDYAAEDADYKAAQLRSDTDFRWPTARSSNSVDEYGDQVSVQILTMFPNMVVQQVRNTIAVRVISAARRRQDRARLGASRLRRRRRDDDRAPPAPGQPDRRRRLYLDGGRLRRRLCAAGIAIQRRRQRRRDDGRPRGAVTEFPCQRGGDPRLLEEIPRPDRRLNHAKVRHCERSEAISRQWGRPGARSLRRGRSSQ